MVHHKSSLSAAVLVLSVALSPSTTQAFSPSSKPTIDNIHAPIPMDASALADLDSEGTAAVPMDAPHEALVAPSSPVSVKSGVHSIPAWGKRVNEFFRMPLITHADKKHAHALGGTAWYFGGMGLLWTSFFREALADDWSAFSSFQGFLPLVCLGAILTTSTNTHMQPQKRMKNYSNFMRNGMVYGAAMALSAAHYSLGPHALPMPIELATQAVVAMAMLKVTEDLIIDRAPVDIRHVITDLKVELPPMAVIIFSAILSILVVTQAMFVMGNVVVGADVTSGVVDPAMASAFAAQMAIAVSMGPGGDALIGTLMSKDRFNNKSGQYTFLRINEEGKFRNRLAVDIFQIIAHFCPGFITIGLALANGHGDVVQQFFHLS